MKRYLLWALMLFGMTGCGGGGFQLNATTPAREAGLSEVTVTVDGALEGKKKSILDSYQVTEHMATALKQSFSGSGSQALRVTITQFRIGSFGPARMHALTETVDQNGNVVKKTEADSTSMRGGNQRTRVQRIAQHIVDQIVAAQ